MLGNTAARNFLKRSNTVKMEDMDKWVRSSIFFDFLSRKGNEDELLLEKFVNMEDIVNYEKSHK